MPPAAEEGAAVVATLPPAVETSLETVPSPENPPLSSDLPSHPVLPSEIVESSAPDRPASEDTTAAMDAPAVTVPPTAVDAPQTEVLPESTPQELPSDTTTSQETSTESQSEESTSPPPPPPPPQVEQTTPTEAAEEPADWADIEEDLSAPDEAELKEIEAAEGDYSAHECKISPFTTRFRCSTKDYLGDRFTNERAYDQMTIGRNPSFIKPTTRSTGHPKRRD